MMQLCELVRGYKTSDETLGRGPGVRRVGRQDLHRRQPRRRRLRHHPADLRARRRGGPAGRVRRRHRRGHRHRLQARLRPRDGPARHRRPDRRRHPAHASMNIYTETADEKFFPPELAAPDGRPPVTSAARAARASTPTTPESRRHPYALGAFRRSRSRLDRGARCDHPHLVDHVWQACGRFARPRSLARCRPDCHTWSNSPAGDVTLASSVTEVTAVTAWLQVFLKSGAYGSVRARGGATWTACRASCTYRGGDRMVVDVTAGAELALTGRLDVSSVADVRAALHDAIDHGTGDLVVDLSGVELDRRHRPRRAARCRPAGQAAGPPHRAARRRPSGPADPASHPAAPGAHAGPRRRLGLTRRVRAGALAGPSYRRVGFGSCGTSPG